MSMALGAIGGLSSIAGTIGGIFGSGQAAHALIDASHAAENYVTNQTNQATGYLSPYMAMGNHATQLLTGDLPSLSQGFNPTMSQLENSPGYQFQLQQGLESAQNGFAARGLGVSGAAMKGAANYANGLASSTYTNLANIYNQNRNTTYDILTGAAGLGQNAAATAGSYNMGSIAPYTSALFGGANAKAANAMAPWLGLQSLGNSLMGQSMGGIGLGALGGSNAVPTAQSVGQAYNLGNAMAANPNMYGP